MSRKLSYDEKENLLVILQMLYGKDRQLQENKHLFNKRTLELTEEAMQKVRRCNNQVNDLVLRLIVGGAVTGRGWLRDVLKEIADALNKNKSTFDMVGCRNASALGYKTDIHTSY